MRCRNRLIVAASRSVIDGIGDEIDFGVLVQYLDRPISRMVIDHDGFKIPEFLPGERLHVARDMPFTVVADNDDAH